MTQIYGYNPTSPKMTSHQNIRHTNYSKGCFHRCCPSNTVFDDIAVTWDYLTSTSTTSLKLSKLSSYQTTLCKISTVSKNTKKRPPLFETINLMERHLLMRGLSISSKHLQRRRF